MSSDEEDAVVAFLAYNILKRRRMQGPSVRRRKYRSNVDRVTSSSNPQLIKNNKSNGSSRSRSRSSLSKKIWDHTVNRGRSRDLIRHSATDSVTDSDCLTMQNDANVDQFQGGAKVNQDDEQVDQDDGQVNQDDEQVNQDDEQVNLDDGQVNQDDGQVNQNDAQVSQDDEQGNKDDAQANQNDAQVNQDDTQVNQDTDHNGIEDTCDTSEGARIPRKVWVNNINKERDPGGVMMQCYPELLIDDEEFQSFARMSRNSFEELLTIIGDRICKTDTNFRKAIPPRERLLLTLRFLATGETSRKLHHQFRIGASTIREISYDVCEAIWDCLKDIEMPQMSEEALKDIAKEFWKKWSFPHCLGAIDGKHIKLHSPSNNRTTFFNNYKSSMVVQGVVDANGIFIAVDVGDSGKYTDGEILKLSSFGTALSQNQLPIPEADKATDEDEELSETLPYVFVGDGAYPLLKYLMRPYPPRGLDSIKEIYNDRHSKARRSVDFAFAMMDTMWPVLTQVLVMTPPNATKVVLACCALYNFVRRRESTMDIREEEETLPQLSKNTNQRINKSRVIKNRNDPLYKVITGRPCREAMEIRDRFAQLFATSLYTPEQDASELCRNAVIQNEESERCQNDESEPCQNDESEPGQNEEFEPCQNNVSETCQNENCEPFQNDGSCQNNESEPCQNDVSDPSQNEESEPCQYDESCENDKSEF